METFNFIPIDFCWFLLHMFMKCIFKCSVDQRPTEFERRETSMLRWLLVIRMCVHYISSFVEFILLNVANKDYAWSDSPSEGLFWCLIALLVFLAVYYFILFIILNKEPFTSGDMMTISYLFKIASILFDILFLSFTVYIANGLKGELDYISELIVIDTACAISAAILTPIAYILFLKDYIEDCKCCKKNKIRPQRRTLPIQPVVHDPPNTITMTHTEIQYIAGGSTIAQNVEGFTDVNASIKQVKYKQTTLSVQNSEKDENHQAVSKTTTLVHVKRSENILTKINGVENMEMSNAKQEIAYTEDAKVDINTITEESNYIK